MRSGLPRAPVRKTLCSEPGITRFCLEDGALARERNGDDKWMAARGVPGTFTSPAPDEEQVAWICYLSDLLLP
jgi:hypothetical protein